MTKERLGNQVREARVARGWTQAELAIRIGASRKTVNTLYEECGGSGLFDKSDFQRLWRDANAAAAHHGLTWDWVSVAWTRMILGIPTDIPGFTFARA